MKTRRIIQHNYELAIARNHLYVVSMSVWCVLYYCFKRTWKWSIYIYILSYVGTNSLSMDISYSLTPSPQSIYIVIYVYTHLTQLQHDIRIAYIVKSINTHIHSCVWVFTIWYECFCLSRREESARYVWTTNRRTINDKWVIYIFIWFFEIQWYHYLTELLS